MNKKERFMLKKRLLQSLGISLSPGAAILDLGCGAGELVKAMRDAGYPAFGCDVAFKKGPHVDELVAIGALKKISTQDYILPFADEAFDVVTSDQVFEHIQDHQHAISEIKRVLRPGGVSLNIYPPPLILLEPHVFVPLAGVIKSVYWLRLWAFLGIRTNAQKELKPNEVALRNYEYLQKKTNYISKSKLEKMITDLGLAYRYCESNMLTHYNQKTGAIMRLNSILPIFPWLCRHFVSRAILIEKRR